MQPKHISTFFLATGETEVQEGARRGCLKVMARELELGLETLAAEGPACHTQQRHPACTAAPCGSDPARH